MALQAAHPWERAPRSVSPLVLGPGPKQLPSGSAGPPPEGADPSKAGLRWRPDLYKIQVAPARAFLPEACQAKLEIGWEKLSLVGGRVDPLISLNQGWLFHVTVSKEQLLCENEG